MMGARRMQAATTGFQTVYRREFPFVWAAARRLGVHPAALDDAVQEVFLTAYRRWDDLDYEISPRAWLYGVTRRIAFRYRRGDARTARRRSALTVAGRPPRDDYAGLEQAHDIDAVLGELEAGRREVFVMAELLDMTGPEIAAELEIPLNTVYSRLRLARQELDRKVRRGAGGWIHLARRTQQPPSGQARRTWALLLPSLGKLSGAGLGTLLTSKAATVVAVASVVGALLVTAWIGRQAGSPAPAAIASAREPKAGATDDPSTLALGHAAAGPTVRSSPSGVSTTRPTPTALPSVPAPSEGPPTIVDAPAPAPASPATGPTRGPHPPPSSPAVDDRARLAAEVAVLDRATSALRHGDAAHSLQWLAEHERRFPAGELVDVRKATRVRALCLLGRRAQAKGEAAALRRDHPDSAVARGIDDVCAGA